MLLHRVHHNKSSYDHYMLTYNVWLNYSTVYTQTKVTVQHCCVYSSQRNADHHAILTLLQCERKGESIALS